MSLSVKKNHTAQGVLTQMMGQWQQSVLTLPVEVLGPCGLRVASMSLSLSCHGNPNQGSQKAPLGQTLILRSLLKSWL
jgi:hypothetical protein